MADEKTGGSAGDNQADITNVKAEFDRKIGNFDKKLSALEDTNRALLNQLQAMNKKPEPTKPATKLDDVWFDQPEVAATAIIEKAEERIMNKIEAKTAASSKQTQVLSTLFAEFPELNNNNHILTKKAVEIYDGYDKDDKQSPMAYRAAVMEAAQELKMVGKSKREDSDESDNEGYAIGGSSSSNSSQTRNRGRSKGVDPATKEFAELVGVNLDDPKVKERVTNGHNRKRGYTRWE